MERKLVDTDDLVRFCATCRVMEDDDRRDHRAREDILPSVDGEGDRPSIMDHGLSIIDHRSSMTTTTKMATTRTTRTASFPPPNS